MEDLRPTAEPPAPVRTPVLLPKGTRYIGPGAAAVTLLRATRLTIHVDQTSGSELSSRALEHLIGVLGKPSDVRTTMLPSAQQSYSLDDLRALEKRRRAKDANLYILALGGTLRGRETQLGVAYGATSFAVFMDRIKASAAGRLGRIEPAVLVHEMGHLLGLVNLGYVSPRSREDPDHPSHSSSEGSVMHWAVEATSVFDLLTGGPPDDFDDDDRADLEAIESGELQLRFSR